MTVKNTLLGAAALAVMATTGFSASASLVYDSSILLSAQGFGSAPRALTVQATGSATSESGCVGVSGSGAIVVGSTGCLANESNVFNGNGVSNLGGDEPNPHSDNQKYGIPSASSLGITDAFELGVLFNATEPSGNGITITDLTLKFYSTAGALLGAIDGQQTFASTNPGNGVAGFTFVVADDQLAYVNGLLGQPGDVLFALEASMTDSASGPESFTIAKVREVPEPATLAMFGFGLLGLGAVARRRKRD